MKNKNIISFAIIVAFTLLLAGCKDPTYSSQSSSPLPDRWQFDPVVVEKIHKNLARGEVAVGLSKLEQRMLEKYGIKIGTSFTTQVYGGRWRVSRTSTGLRFEKSMRLLEGVNLQSFPITQPRYKVRPVSVRGADQENGFPYIAWQFDKALQNKIQKRIFLKGIPSVIGLSRFQQKLLQRYGVRVGQIFQTSAAGRVITVKRVSLGLQIQGIANNKSASYFIS